MKTLETIRYCNECPFRRYQAGGGYYFCSLPDYLRVNSKDVLKIDYKNYSRPPEECMLRDEGVGFEIEEQYKRNKTPQVPENKDKRLDGVD